MSARIRVTLLIAIPLLVACSLIAKARPRNRGSGCDKPPWRELFIPRDPKELAATVDGFLAQAAVPAQKGQIVALIAPHAGYPFSGAVAAHSYALLKGRPTHRVVVIAPSHYEAFQFASVYEGDAYATSSRYDRGGQGVRPEAGGLEPRNQTLQTAAMFLLKTGRNIRSKYNCRSCSGRSRISELVPDHHGRPKL